MNLGIGLEINQDYLLQCFNYNPLNGDLVWREDRPSSHFSRYLDYRSWYTKCAGKVAGSRVLKRGKPESLVVHLKGVRIKAHNLIWLYCHNKLCDEGFILDHINGNPLDNRLCNLREVTLSENQRNRKKNSNNSSGVNGVYWTEFGWRAYGKRDGKSVSIATCGTIEEAALKRKEWELAEEGYTVNHGRNKV